MKKSKLLTLKFSLIVAALSLAIHVNAAKRLAFVIAESNLASIADDDVKAAANWFLATYSEGDLLTTTDISNGADLSVYGLIWFYSDNSNGILTLPSAFTNATVLNPLKTYYKNGGNLLLTGLATQYIVDLGRIANDPGIIGAGVGGFNPDVWGVSAKIGDTRLDVIDTEHDYYSHPIFEGLSIDSTTLIFDTVQPGNEIRYKKMIPLIGSGNKEDHNAMWDIGGGNNISDSGLVSFQDLNDLTVLGTWSGVTDFCCAGIIEFDKTSMYGGKALAIGLAAYEFNRNDGVNPFQSNIEGLTENAIAYLLTSDTVEFTVYVNRIVVSSEGDAVIVDSSVTLQMSAEVLPADATDKTVSWAVINGTGEAEISASGLLTAVAYGTVIVQTTANDGSGVKGTFNITISNQTISIENISKSEFTIYPNPVNDKLIINNTSAIAHVEIIQIDGSVIEIITNNNENKMEINTTALEQGVYLLRVTTNDGRMYTSKVIKQ